MDSLESNISLLQRVGACTTARSKASPFIGSSSHVLWREATQWAGNHHRVVARLSWCFTLVVCLVPLKASLSCFLAFSETNGLNKLDLVLGFSVFNCEEPYLASAWYSPGRVSKPVAGSFPLSRNPPITIGVPVARSDDLSVEMVEEVHGFLHFGHNIQLQKKGGLSYFLVDTYSRFLSNLWFNDLDKSVKRIANTN